MVGKYRNIAQIENYFNMLLTQAKICDKVFVGKLPPAVKSEWKTIAFAAANKTSDLNAFGETSVNVYLYCKPTGDLLEKDIKTFNKLETAFMKVLNDAHHDYYSLRFMWSDSDFDTTRQLDYIVICVGVLIKSHKE